MVKPHKSDIRMTYEYIRVTYGWHTSDIRMTYEYIRVTYRWHTSTYEWHTDDIRVHTSDIRMTYEYIRVTYEWHTNSIRVHTIYIRMTHKLLTNDLRMTQEILDCVKDFELSDLVFKIVCGKIIALGGCKWFLITMLFWSPYFFIRILRSSTAGSGNLNNLKGIQYYILQSGSMFNF